MKLYHPTAHFRNSAGQVTGFILRNDKDKNVPQIVVNIPTFHRLVAEDKVQLFQPTLSAVELKLTAEEQRKYKKHAEYIQDLQTYLDNDIIFHECDIEKALNIPGYMAISIVYAVEMAYMPLVGFSIFRGEPFTPSELKYMKTTCKLSLSKQNSTNVVTGMGLWDSIKGFITLNSMEWVGISTTTIEHGTAVLRCPKIPLTKRITPAAINQICQEAAWISQQGRRAATHV